ncbi:hypothetical protein GEMRC1_005105 [Eukaryota sp. GEM-RC1]
MLTPLPEPLLKRSRSSPSSIPSVMSDCDELSMLSSSTHFPSKRVHVQQTLLILIHLHLLTLLFKRSLELQKIPLRFIAQLTALKTVLPAFFGQVGYVSNHFFDSSFQAVKLCFQLHTFHAADLQSVFLHTDGILEIENFLNYSGIITGLRIKLRKLSDLEFLNTSSAFFPRLKELEVVVIQHAPVSMLLIEALKTNTTVTSVTLVGNSIGDEGARALAGALKVNSSVTSVDLCFNSIGDEGARALAGALKVNSSVTSVILGSNSIGAEGAKGLAEALKVNDTITSINLRNNCIGDEGEVALVDALKVNHRIKIEGATAVYNQFS